MTRREYYEYLRSPQWRLKKAQYERFKGYKRCFICGTSRRVELHHRTYKRLGAERMQDLAWLCRRCHEKTHQINKNGNGLKTAHKKLRKGLFRHRAPLKDQVIR